VIPALLSERPRRKGWSHSRELASLANGGIQASPSASVLTSKVFADALWFERLAQQLWARRRTRRASPLAPPELRERGQLSERPPPIPLRDSAQPHRKQEPASFPVSPSPPISVSRRGECDTRRKNPASFRLSAGFFAWRLHTARHIPSARELELAPGRIWSRRHRLTQLRQGKR
jgi:hypothetical protein